MPQPAATARTRLEPLRVDHAEQMVSVLGDRALYDVIGGQPPTLEELVARYERQLAGPSRPNQAWLNWIVVVDDQSVGFVQATTTDDGTGTVADVGWVIGVSAQGRGLATEATAAAVAQLQAQGVTTFSAHIADGHLASVGVARRLGFRPTEVVEGGERVWTLTRDPSVRGGAPGGAAQVRGGEHTGG